jgi:hypothetical protein
MARVVRYIAISQISFFACLSVCAIIMPGFLLERNEGGVSNYGVHWQTVMPYTLAFLLCSIFLALAAFKLPRSQFSGRFRVALLIVAGSLLLVLCSTYPYKLNATFKDTHIATGIELFCLEMVLAFWLALTFLRDWRGALLLAVQIAGFLLATLTLFGTLHVLFVAQMVTSLAFGLLLWQSAKRLLVSQTSRP